MSERILLLGSGGREHALAWSMRKSASCATLWCAPGNPGIAEVAEPVSLSLTDAASVVEWCQVHKPTCIVIGPEQPLASGVSDALRSAGFAVFGPSAAAARLESSKGFAKDFMLRHAIPTAAYKRFTNRDEAEQYVKGAPLPVVVKYDGLAAGKGVVVAHSQQEAILAVQEMFAGSFGSDGVVIEEFLEGVEASIFAVTDGKEYVTLAPAHDYKRIGDVDTGKNTGGMGSVAPSPRVTSDVLMKVKTRIIEPTLRGMNSEGMPFIGCLYCGIMIDQGGNPYVVEFNARFGDPETQSVLSVLRADTAELVASAARGSLNTSAISDIAEGIAVCVVLASGGYPDSYAKGVEITGIHHAETDHEVRVFHAGTAWSSGGEGRSPVLVTNGGRVLGVTAVRDTLEAATVAAYEACDCISFDMMYYRTDIGKSK